MVTGAFIPSARLAPIASMSRLPDEPDGGEVTMLLRAWSDGDADAFDRVLPLVYDELHRMAARYLVGERSSISLQATALVNELCLRLLGWRSGPLAEPRALFRSLGPDDATCARGHRAATTRRAAWRPRRDSCASRGDRRPGERAGRRPACGRHGAPDARGRGPAQGAGRGASLLWRSLDRGDRRGARDLGPHGSRGLGVRAGVAVPNADRVHAH